MSNVTPLFPPEPTVEIAESVLCAEIVTWGESNMELLENASKDLLAVEELILTVKREGLAIHGKHILLDIAHEKLHNAQRRVECCHNELDCEREDNEGAS